MDDLRRYIAQVIREAYTPPSLANKIKDLALLMSHPQAGADQAYFILTRKMPKNKLVFHASRWKNSLKFEKMLAVMKVRKPSRPCNGAYEIAYAAADEDFGPTLYDIVMGWSPNGLISDRNSVSMDADNVWNTYMHNRDEVTKARLDPVNNQFDIEGYFTPEKEDDCSPGSEYSEPAFDQSGQNAQSIGRSDRQGKVGYYYGLHSSYSYNLPSQEIDKMIARGKPIIDALVRDGVPVTDFLMDISLSFFHSRDR